MRYNARKEFIMKKIAGLFLATLLLALSCMFVFSSCSNKIDITFVQEGQENIVKTIKKGESLTDIPTPVSKDGYTIVWDVTEFENLNNSLTVNAVETPNQYTITYEVEPGVLTETTQVVTFDSNVVYYKPLKTAPNSEFGGWKIKGTETVLTDGVYKIASDVTLVFADWISIDDWSENR